MALFPSPSARGGLWPTNATTSSPPSAATSRSPPILGGGRDRRSGDRVCVSAGSTGRHPLRFTLPYESLSPPLHFPCATLPLHSVPGTFGGALRGEPRH